MNVVTYRDLGVRRVVNGGGTYTILGGSLMSPEVIEAMDKAARHFVLIDELYDKAGRFLAEIIGSESAYVTSGAAAGLVLATAACITAKDVEKMKRLPSHLRHPKRGHRSEIAEECVVEASTSSRG